jgi:hypothetical protein
LKGLAILILLGLLLFTFIPFVGSFTAAKAAWGTWTILGGCLVLEVAALIAVIRGD